MYLKLFLIMMFISSSLMAKNINLHCVSYKNTIVKSEEDSYEIRRNKTLGNRFNIDFSFNKESGNAELEYYYDNDTKRKMNVKLVTDEYGNKVFYGKTKIHDNIIVRYTTKKALMTYTSVGTMFESIGTHHLKCVPIF